MADPKIKIPARIGYAGGNLRGLHRVLTEIVNEIDDIEGMDSNEVRALIEAALEPYEAVLEAVPPRVGSVTLAGRNPTPVAFGDSAAATALSDAGPFNIVPGQTLKVTVDGGTKRTVTFEATHGYHLGDSGGADDTHLESDNKIKVGVDGATPVEIAFDWTGCTTAILTAAQMETAIAGEFAGTQVIASPETFELDVGTATGGTFALLRNGVAISGAGAIAYNASAATVQTLLRAEYGDTAVSVTKNGTKFTITFAEAFHTENGHAGLTANLESLTYPDGADATFEQVDATGFKYLIVSPTQGTGSAVEIDNASEDDACDLLEIGPLNGTSVGGTGDAADISKMTADEVATKLTAILVTQYEEPVEITATEDEKVRLATTTLGAEALLEFDDTSTATALGLTSADNSQGASGLGYETDMANAEYHVFCQVENNGDPGNVSLAVGQKATSGFNIYCDTPTAKFNVAVVIFGQGA